MRADGKDNYDFGFLTLDEGYKEEALEDALEKQLTRDQFEDICLTALSNAPFIDKKKSEK